MSKRYRDGLQAWLLGINKIEGERVARLREEKGMKMVGRRKQTKAAERRFKLLPLLPLLAAAALV